MQVKGLDGELVQPTEFQFTSYCETEYADNEDVISQEHIKDSRKPIEDTRDTGIDITNEESYQMGTRNKLDLQIQHLIEKCDGKWKCKECGKASALRGNMKRHAETHIEGMEFNCHICSKIYSTSKNLGSHMSKFHTGLFNCDHCDKRGMSRKAYNEHNLKHHK